MMPYSRRQQSWKSSKWEPQITHKTTEFVLTHIWNSTCKMQSAEHLSLTWHVTALGVVMLETTKKTVDIHWVLRILISGSLAGRTGFVFQQKKTFFLTSTRPVARAQPPNYSYCGIFNTGRRQPKLQLTVPPS